MPQYIQYILHGITSALFVSHSSFLTAKSVDLAFDDFLLNRNHLVLKPGMDFLCMHLIY